MKTENVAESHQTDIPYTFPAGHETTAMEDDSAPSEDVSADGIDLIACSDVRYENHRGVPGLCYQLDGETNWTRVKPKRKRRRKRQDSTIQLQQSQESSDEELDVAEARGVQYKVKGGIPGLEIRRGCTLSSVSWTPVTPVSCCTCTYSTANQSKDWNYYVYVLCSLSVFL